MRGVEGGHRRERHSLNGGRKYEVDGERWSGERVLMRALTTSNGARVFTPVLTEMRDGWGDRGEGGCERN